MDWHGYVALWCAVWGAVALVGFGRSLAGVTRAQRAVRMRGRIERVHEPRHGGSRSGGVAVVVSYPDPSTGEAVTVTNEGERGDAITVAWEGREIGVHHPPGQAHAYRFTEDPEARGWGLAWPGTAVFLIYGAVVVLLSVDRGWPWALICVCGPWALIGFLSMPGNLRDTRLRRERLESMVAVPGRIVAVLRDVSTDSDGDTTTTITPVVAFTTREGLAVTAHRTSGVPDPAGAYGREVTVHYPPQDPALFVLDHPKQQRSVRTDTLVSVVGLVLVAAAAVLGVVLL
ncbi:DUF3592 domain-containing protein [Kitasatospora sp. NPDC101183]|uniref:DUF3592 domain-containing protein n=1 Tax=Kitasatospora sp. NPDC101183 TaxID=3364100 RepID=UPI0037F42FBE